MPKKIKISTDSDVNWKNDNIQFARLIAECDACGVFSAANITKVAKEMDLDREFVLELIERAQSTFDDIKSRTPSIKKLKNL